MRLYVSKNNKWTGTQLDAKASGAYEQVEVPTDKAGLMAFLNDLTYANDERVEQPVEKWTASDDQMAAIGLNQYPSKGQTYPPANTLVGKCSLVELKELSTTLQQLLFKAWSEMEQQQD
jgi:hypothetical protein